MEGARSAGLARGVASRSSNAALLSHDCGPTCFVCRCVGLVEEMDKNDEELRESIMKLWPLQGPTMHMLLVPPNEGNRLSLIHI